MPREHRCASNQWPHLSHTIRPAGVGANVNAAQGKSTRAEPTAAWRVLQSADGATAATDEWLRLLDDRDEHVRVSAIRRLTDNWPLDTLLGPHPRAVKVVDEKIRIALIRAAQQDQSGLVQLTLASVLQRLPVQHRAELAKELLQRTELATDRYFPLLVWYGLIPVGNQSPKTIAELAVNNRIPILQRYMARMLTTQAETDARPLNHMLTQIYRAGGAPLEEALTGMTQAYQGVRKAKAPEVWSELARSAETTTPTIKRLVQRLNVIYGDGVALDELRKVVLDNKEEMQLRQQALASLIEARPADLQRLCQSVLDIRVLNATALRGLGLVDDPATARSVALKIKRFQPDDRPAVIEWLVSRASSANELLDVIAQKNSPIAPTDLSVYQARRILAMNDAKLSEKLGRVWGQLREGSSERRQAIAALKTQLNDAVLKQADLPAGRRLFQKTCSQCHQLYDQGKRVGPDLTGSQRGNLDYLLENIVDPSSVVGKDYRMTTVLTSDGRTLGGLVVSKNEKTLVLQTQTDQETLPLDEIEELRETSLSPMPEGMLDKLSAQEVRDLIAYLMHPTQVAP